MQQGVVSVVRVALALATSPFTLSHTRTAPSATATPIKPHPALPYRPSPSIKADWKVHKKLCKRHQATCDRLEQTTAILGMGTEAVFADAASTYLISEKIEVSNVTVGNAVAKIKSYVTVLEDEGFICPSLAEYVRGPSFDDRRALVGCSETALLANYATKKREES